MEITETERLLLDVIQKYDSYEKCCEKLGIKVDYFENLPKHEAAYKMLCIIAKAFNGNKISMAYYMPRFWFDLQNGNLNGWQSTVDGESAYFNNLLISTPDRKKSLFYFKATGPKAICYVSVELAEKSADLFYELWFNFLTGQE